MQCEYELRQYENKSQTKKLAKNLDKKCNIVLLKLFYHKYKLLRNFYTVPF